MNRVSTGILVLLMALIGPESASARMYQWVSPATGTQQMSGEPPSWYRAEHGGPRVLVFEGGYLVDDTNIKVSSGRREALREEAFEELARRRTIEALHRLGKTAEEAKRVVEEADQPTLVERAVEAVEKIAPNVSELPDVLDADAVERLKEIISEFDKRGN